jgi:hypothetical protein
MSQRILVIQNDGAAARSIFDALSHCSDPSFCVEWVRCCSHGLDRLDGIEAILVDL